MQVRGLKFPVACLESGTKSRSSERHAEGKSAAQRPFSCAAVHFGAQKSLLQRVSLRRRPLPDSVPDLVPKSSWHKNDYSCQ